MSLLTDKFRFAVRSYCTKVAKQFSSSQNNLNKIDLEMEPDLQSEDDFPRSHLEWIRKKSVFEPIHFSNEGIDSEREDK